MDLYNIIPVLHGMCSLYNTWYWFYFYRLMFYENLKNFTEQSILVGINFNLKPCNGLPMVLLIFLPVVCFYVLPEI